MWFRVLIHVTHSKLYVSTKILTEVTLICINLPKLYLRCGFGELLHWCFTSDIYNIFNTDFYPKLFLCNLDYILKSCLLNIY